MGRCTGPQLASAVVQKQTESKKQSQKLRMRQARHKLGVCRASCGWAESKG